MVKKYFLVFSVILFISLASASFAVGNLSHSIQKSYAPEGTITGWINISFDNEPADSLFKSSEGDSVELKQLLNKNFVYTCNPTGCEQAYSATGNAQSTLNFDLKKGESKLIGFKFNENIREISSVSFKVSSDATSSCENQLKLNFFNDNTIHVGNNKSSAELCSNKNYGCFNDNTPTFYNIGSTPYCQKINLSESPGVALGAWVVKEENGNKQFTMTLYDSHGDKVTDCELSGISDVGREVFCDVDYSITEPDDYYVCISGDAGSGTFKTRGISTSDGCGFWGMPIRTYTNFYQIFAIGKEFNDFATLNITNSLAGKNLGSLIEDYIISKYGTLDCSGGCIVPLKFESAKNQSVTLKNLQINYEEVGGILTGNKFYELNKIAAKINSDMQKLYLDEGKFSVPGNYGNTTFSLKFNGKDIFSEKISIDKTIPLINGVSPTTTAAAFPTKFRVNVNSTSNISSYKWEFDDDTKTTTTNKITYTFDSIGMHQLKVSVTDLNQQSSSKVFNINVTSPKNAINITLKNDFENLANIKSQINNFTGFYKDSLSSLLNLTMIETMLTQIQNEYSDASSDDEYIDIMTELADLRIPMSISISQVANEIPFYPDENSIDLNVLTKIGGGDYSSGQESKYVNAIFAWYQENIETKIDYKRISANYESGMENLLNFFELDIKEKNNLNYDYYLVLGLSDVTFKDNYNQKTEGGYVYLSPSNKIVFSTTDELDFTNLFAFISPGINKLVISDDGGTGGAEPKGFNWSLFVAVIAGLILVAVIIYVILQQWYKKKYENYLFKDRNNLLNLMTYIEGEKRKEIEEENIDEKLKKAGWSSEQRDYVLRKHAGKRTGMFELPITKIIEKLKNKEDVRQGKIPK